MASLAKSLKTDSMGDMDLKALAQVLRSRGRGRDTVLAHITPDEARLLKARGGRGSRNPDTGLLEFEEDDFSSYGAGFDRPEAPQPSISNAAADVVPQQSTFDPSTPAQTYDAPFTPAAGQGAPVNGTLPFETVTDQAPGGAPSPAPVSPGVLSPPGTNVFGTMEAATGGQVAPSAGQAAPQPAPQPATRTTADQSWLAKTLGISDANLGLAGRLGMGLGGGLLGLQSRAAAQQQAKQATGQIAALGAPQQQQGAELIRQAQTGELSQQSQQAYQAAQAQLAQQSARTGGVGAAQNAAQLEMLRNQLLNNQYQLGLSVSGIGNQYALQAITTGLQANQQANQASQNFYAALAGYLGGVPTVQRTTPATTTPGA